MAYILDLFTPETWARFCESEGKVSGFRSGQSKLAHRRVKIGDVFLCYMTRLSRWCGILEVESAPYWDDTPIYDDPDPFVVRFRVKPLVVLDPEHSIPIRHEVLWNHLSITKEHKLGSSTWTGSFRGSLRILTAEDGAYIEQCLQEQQRNPIAYALTEKEKREFEGIVKLST
ncbi:MAG: EVE domain-containing protein, partial [Chloroflexota bacterium]|nr:EVE domain-containing protein [Chloroflexota bacterium]